MKSGILYEFNNNYNFSNEKELLNKEQTIINWLNTIKEPHCLLINKLYDKFILDGTIFIEILKIFLKKYALYKFIPGPDVKLDSTDKFKLLCTLLIKIEKDKNKLNSLYYFYKYDEIIYKDRNILINFFLLLKQLYEKYIMKMKINNICLNKSLTASNINNSKEKKKEKIINKNETIDIQEYNTLLKKNRKIKKHSRNYINHSTSNPFLSLNNLSNLNAKIKEQIIQNNKTIENYNHIKKKRISPIKKKNGNKLNVTEKTKTFYRNTDNFNFN